MTTSWKQDAVGLSEAFHCRQLSPSDVLAETLNRIESLQPEINAYSCVNSEVMKDAVASELSWANGTPIGPMDGIPLTINDNMSVKGMLSNATDGFPAPVKTKPFTVWQRTNISG